MGFTVTLERGGFPAYNLTTGFQGVKLLGGVGGFLAPEFTAFWSERIGDGDRWRGSRLGRREITLRLKVGSGVTGLSWREVDRAFWRTISRDNPSFLAVHLEDASSRYLAIRLDRATQATIDFDPALTGYQLYLVTVVAEDPYWKGTDVVQAWTFAAAGENFYGGAAGGGLGPPYVLSASGGFGEAMVTNSGDVPAWPRWKVTGPCDSATLTVDGHTIALPLGVPAMTSRYIDTDPPDVYGDVLESRWSEMTGAVDFWPVPVGATVPVTAQLGNPSAAAAVTMTITPRYERAW